MRLSDRHAWVASLQLPGVAKSILRVLADHANSETLKCWPSAETISRESGYSIRHVQRVIKNLVREEVIDVECSSGRKSNRYTLLLNHDRVSGLNDSNHDRVSPEPVINQEKNQKKDHFVIPAICERVFAYWKKLWEHPRAKLDAKRKRAIKARLKDGYTELDLIQAIDGCKATPFNNGDNDRGQRYDDLTLILRDAEHVDRFIANADKPPGKSPTRPTRCVL